MLHSFSLHKKSPEILPLANEKYPWLFHQKFSNESIEARYYVLEFLAKQYSYTGRLEQDTTGKPLPILLDIPLFWSISHTQNYIAYIISTQPVGIDIAEYAERHTSLLSAHSDLEYWQIGGKNWQNFYRLWVGKEAIIKKIWWKLDDMKNIHLKKSFQNSKDIFEFQNEMHTIHYKLTDAVILAYTAT